ncbi:MAG: MBL fold metallo-hydrolase [Clostridiales bacterium]|jgi:competence protein ComEC|nr:MBL fold metallo-hydrolase [Clostridiales bacterium]
MYNKKLFRLPTKISAFLLIALILFLLWHMVYLHIFQEDTAVSDPVAAEDLLHVYYIDVGQGDSAIIQGPDFNMLIDAGESAPLVTEYIEQLEIDSFDYVVATHPHADHIGGMAEIISAYDIDTFIMPDVTHNSKAFEDMIDALEKSDANVIEPEPGAVFTKGDIVFTILGPISDEYENLNDYSVSLILEYGNVSYMFTGDAESLYEAELIENYDNLKADILKAPHHGSVTSSSRAFIEAVNPQMVIISSGEDNSYGHPHDEILKLYEEMDIPVLRTDERSSIVVYTDGNEFFYGSEE